MPPGVLAPGEGEGVANIFVGNAEIRAGTTPLRAVRGNPFSRGTLKGDEMGQLVQKRALDFIDTETVE